MGTDDRYDGLYQAGDSRFNEYVYTYYPLFCTVGLTKVTWKMKRIQKMKNETKTFTK